MPTQSAQQLLEQLNRAEDDALIGGARGKTRSSDSRTSSAHASRHQAAEQRRRTRINERLDLLRKLVPHAERANTACFLEEVIKYIDALKKRNAELEKALSSAHVPVPTSSASGTPPQQPLMEARLADANPERRMPTILEATLLLQLARQQAQAQKPEQHSTVGYGSSSGSGAPTSFSMSTLPPELQRLLRDAAPHTPPSTTDPNAPPAEAASGGVGGAVARTPSGDAGHSGAAASTGPEGDSLPSSEDLGMPLKKRKVLVL